MAEERVKIESFEGPGRPIALARALLFLSGGVALAQELLWLRWFSALLGATATAAAATLCGVFLGYAAGNLVGGRVAPRIRRPLLAYGVLELAAAAAALAMPSLFSAAERFVAPLRQAFAAAPALGAVVATLGAALLVLPPTLCAGATLPVVAPGLGPRGAPLVYSANTFGAAAGTLALPFLILPALGMVGSVRGLAALGAAVGAVACLAGLRARPADPAPAAKASPRAAPDSEPIELDADPLPSRGLAALSGFLLLGLELAYTRLFAQIHESTLHAFAIVLAAFLAALALGTLVARLLLTRGHARPGAIALAWVVAGPLLAVVPWLFDQLSDGLHVDTGASAVGVLRLAGIAALTLVPPVALAGAALPLLLHAPDRPDGPAGRRFSGRALGRLLAWNTLGSLAGPPLVAFVAFPLLGSARTFALLAAALVAASLALDRGAERRGPRVGALALAVCGLMAVQIPSRVWLDRRVGEQLVEIAEGPQGVVAVIERPPVRSIKVDNHYLLGGTGSIGDERQLGHLPLLLHPDPKRVAFLGLGTAITASAAVLHPVAEIDAVELLPEVASAARRWFAAANLSVLDDPRTRLVLDDARTFLAAPPGGFDVLVGDLVVPWRAGESALYTREHFEHARAALNDGGLFCQWLPAYQLSVAQFDTIAATFLDVFPRTTLWRGDWFAGMPTLALVGHTRDVDPDAVAARVAALRPKLDAMSPYLVDVAGIWLYLIGPLERDLARFRSARRHTFDAPWLELAGPRANGETGPRAEGAVDPDETIAHAPLAALLAEIAALPLAGTPLEKLRDGRELAWRAAGAEIWRAAELGVGGRGDEGRALALHTLEGLPAPLRDAILNGVH